MIFASGVLRADSKTMEDNFQLIKEHGLQPTRATLLFMLEGYMSAKDRAGFERFWSLLPLEYESRSDFFACRISSCGVFRDR